MLVPEVNTYQELLDWMRDERQTIHITILKSIRRAIGKDLDVADVIRAYVDDMTIKIDVPASDWLSTLDKSLTYFEEVEDYEKCAMVKELQKEINAS